MGLGPLSPIHGHFLRLTSPEYNHCQCSKCCTDTISNAATLNRHQALCKNHIESFVCRVTGFTIPLAHGRGLFYGPIGLLPFQEPINVVVGSPIAVEKYPGSNPHCSHTALCHNWGHDKG